MEVKASVDEVVGAAKEAQGVWRRIRSYFAGPKPNRGNQDKPVAKAAGKKKDAYVAVDETKVMVTIVQQLSEFFKLQETLAAHIREEEEKSRSIFNPDQNQMEAALKRVMAMDQMAALEVQIRETMVYQSPPEMGALYSKVFEMRDVIAAEQEAARLAQEQKERRLRWLRHQRQANLNLKAGASVLTLILILYLWTWFVWLSQWRKI
jgi:hypothetical protein